MEFANDETAIAVVIADSRNSMTTDGGFLARTGHGNISGLSD